jgi:threonine synthase
VSFVIDLECARCSSRFPADRITNVCSACNSPLLVRYDLAAIRRSVDRDAIALRAPTMWRYEELLPIEGPSEIVSLGEGFTPNLRLTEAGNGFRELWLKDEGLNPTGTFKARGAAAGVTSAKALGVQELAMPTAGNAGGAWAAYAARAGLRAHIVMPADAPEMNKKEAWAYGADVRLVRGLISDAGAIVARACARYGWFDASTLKEPYRIEGKKTMGLEIAEQFDWQPPEVIIYPAGGGVGLIGIWKAFDELRELGWMDPALRPRLIAVQAEGCMPVVAAYEAGREESEFWQNAATIAAGIRVPKALGDFIVLRAIRETHGVAVAVADSEIREAIARLAEQEGTLVCPEGAATYAAALKLRASGNIQDGERVLLLNTGSGLKYPEVLAPELEVLDPTADI